MEKQKLLFHQARLSNRGVAEMVLLHISASKGVPSEMVMKTLELGIAILRGGNIDIQMVSLMHLSKEYMCNNNASGVMILGYAESFEGEKGCRIFHVHRWSYEFV